MKESQETFVQDKSPKAVPVVPNYSLLDTPSSWTLHYPGVDGVPFRGPANVQLTQQEYDNLELVRDAKAAVFDLSDPQHLALYNKVLDGASKEIFFIVRQDVKWSEKRDCFIVFLHWEELFYELPRARHTMSSLKISSQKEYGI